MNRSPDTSPPSAAHDKMSLRFDASLATVEGVLAVVQEWVAERGILRDDALSLRLVLEELLINICLHAKLPDHNNKIDLQMKILGQQNAAKSRIGAENTQTSLHITLRDYGQPFNPLTHVNLPLGDIKTASEGGRGLTLVRLIATQMDYLRAQGSNQLDIAIPLLTPAGETGRLFPGHAKTLPKRPLERLWAFWCSSIALRQTVLFTLSSIVLIWGAITLYSIEIANQRHESSLMLTRQAMHTQAVISSTFLDRVGGGLENVAQAAREMPEYAALLARPDDFVKELQKGAALRSLWAEIPVLGLAIGYGGKTWLYRLQHSELEKQEIKTDLAAFAAQGTSRAQWQSLFINFLPDDPHAAMIYALALAPSGRTEDGWIGTIITMPWIAGTLRALSGFKHAAAFYTDSQGRYVIFPPGRALGQGAQSLGQEARLHGAPELENVERAMLEGQIGAVQLRPVFDGDKTPWNLPWEGPTTLAYYPMMTKGWYLGLLISSDELGDAPRGLPPALFFMAALGPLCIGLITWFVTSRTLRPLNELADALEGFGSGNLEAPFPRARFPDEIGVMLTTFERVRVTLRASFRNLVTSAADQQRMQNELNLARNIQQSMLPKIFPQLSWVNVDARIDMCREVCGDLYDCFSPHAKPERLCCVIGDVCGKGVPAAIIMSRTMSLARSFLQEGYGPAETLEKLNTALLRTDASSMFVTMLVGILEPDGLFCWASAGHPPPLPGPEPLETGEGFSAEQAPLPPWPGELVLGVRKKQTYSTHTAQLKPGQSLLLYTDGADEAMGPPAGVQNLNEIYGETRLAASLDKACRAAQDSKNIVASLRQDITSHMQGLSPADDISLMVMTYTGADDV